MPLVPDYPDEKGARCARCGRGMIVPNEPGGGEYICEDCCSCCNEDAKDEVEFARPDDEIT